MPLSLATNAPSDGIEAIRKALDEIRARPGTVLQHFSAEVLDRLEVSLPHPVFMLGLDDAAADKLTEAAKLVSWRYLLIAGEESAPAAAEVRAGAGENTVEFLHVDSGPFVGAMVDAIAMAEKLHVVEQQDFEIRLLQVPAIYLVALWLHNPASDIFIPIGKTPPQIARRQPYPAAEFKPLVAALARSRQAVGNPDLASVPAPCPPTTTYSPPPPATQQVSPQEAGIFERIRIFFAGSRKKPPSNLDPECFPELSWATEAESKRSIDALYRYAEMSVQQTISWYFREKKWKGRFGRWLRCVAIVLTAIGTLIPLLASSDLEIRGKKAKEWIPFGYVALALAGACVALDRFFGFSSAWIRYVTTAMTLRKVLAEFYMDWAVLTSAASGAVATSAQREALLKRISALLQRVEAEVEKETAEWAAEYRTSITEIEKSAREQLNALKPGTVVLTIANFTAASGSPVSVLLDGRPHQTATGAVSTITPVFPGIHIVTVEGKLGDKEAGDSHDVSVSAGQAVPLTLTLKPKTA